MSMWKIFYTFVVATLFNNTVESTRATRLVGYCRPTKSIEVFPHLQVSSVCSSTSLWRSPVSIHSPIC